MKTSRLEPSPAVAINCCLASPASESLRTWGTADEGRRGNTGAGAAAAAAALTAVAPLGALVWRRRLRLAGGAWSVGRRGRLRFSPCSSPAGEAVSFHVKQRCWAALSGRIAVRETVVSPVLQREPEGSLIVTHMKSIPWAEQRRRLQGSLASQLLLQARGFVQTHGDQPYQQRRRLQGLHPLLVLQQSEWHLSGPGRSRPLAFSKPGRLCESLDGSAEQDAGVRAPNATLTLDIRSELRQMLLLTV